MYEKARLKLQKAAAVRGQDAHRRELYREVIAALTVALAGGISDDREERARFMLTHAHFEAGECFFKQRDCASARKHFEAGLGGHGLSDATEEHIRKYHVYCVYAVGKQKAQDHQYEAAKEDFEVVLNGQHKRWLQRWNTDSKDYVAIVKQHIKEAEMALRMETQKMDADTRVSAWAETNQLVQQDEVCSAQFLLEKCKCPPELADEIDVDELRGAEGEEYIDDLCGLHQKMNRM
jgi:hypothetical protein